MGDRAEASVDRFPSSRPPIVQPSQRRLVAYLEGEPGRSIQEIADHLGVTRTAAVYHVRRLERRGLIVALEQGNRRLHFPAQDATPIQRSLLGLLRLRTARCVAEALHSDPTVGWRELARRLRLAPHTIRWHVARLEEHGLLRVSAESGRKHYASLHPDMAAALRANRLPERTEPRLEGELPPL